MPKKCKFLAGALTDKMSTVGAIGIVHSARRQHGNCRRAGRTGGQCDRLDQEASRPPEAHRSLSAAEPHSCRAEASGSFVPGLSESRIYAVFGNLLPQTPRCLSSTLVWRPRLSASMSSKAQRRQRVIFCFINPQYRGSTVGRDVGRVPCSREVATPTRSGFKNE